VLLGAVFLGEHLTLRVIAGMVVVLGGVALTRIQKRVPAAVPVMERV
jgi:drug/metabolite transporter (DMT)-like permease